LNTYYSSYYATYTGGGIHTVNLFVNTKLNIVDRDNPVVFYGVIGLGPSFFFNDAFSYSYTYPYSGGGSSPGYSETDFALRFGLGIDIHLGKGMAIFVESNGIGTFVSQYVSSTSSMVYSTGTVGLKLDN
jgi:hypothetical protein